MLRADPRASLTAADRALAVELLSRGSATQRADLEARTDALGPDALWDDPGLVPALLAYRGLAAPSATLFVYAVLRRLLLEIGIDDRGLTDYCASLVLAFGRGDRAYRIGEHDECRYEYLSDLLAEAERAEGERQFRIRVHLGDFALWLAGIFPDYIAARRARKGGPDLPYYEALGSSGFRMASDHELASRYGLDGVLRSAGERFVALRIAMNRLSDRLMFPRHHSPDRLMRQVRDEFRLPPVQ
jgi:hypothetical protein